FEHSVVDAEVRCLGAAEQAVTAARKLHDCGKHAAPPDSRELSRKWRPKFGPYFLETSRGKWRGEGLDGEEVAGAGVAARVAELRHGPGFDLADALPGEVEVFADLFEGAGLAAVEAEAEAEDLPLTLVERPEQLGD